MRCIICRVDKSVESFPPEHIFPESIGGTLTINAVCRECNSILGHSVDCHLTNHLLIQLALLALKILGKTGKVPNPIEKGILDGKQDKKVLYKFDKKGNPQELYIIPNVEKEKDGENEKITITLDKKDKGNLYDVINKILERKGLPGLDKEEIEKHIQEGIVPSPVMQVSKTVELVKYKIAILKIAYELAYYWLGEKYLEDKTGELLLSCILDFSEENLLQKYPIRGTIGIIEGEAPQFLLWGKELNSHIAFLKADNKRISCCIKIFNVFQGIVCISESAHLYPDFTPKFIAIEPMTGVKRESEFVTEVERISQ